MSCDTWSERVKFESNTTPRFLTRVLVRPEYQEYWKVRKELFLEPIKINSALSGFSFN